MAPAWADGAHAPGAAPVRPTGSSIHLVALAFAASTVDATTGTAKVGLSWTIADSARHISDVGGDIFLGVPGTTSGTFRSATFEVRFDLHGAPHVKVSGTARKSTYNYTFHVPRYAQVNPARWRVYRMTIHDNQGNKVTLTSRALKSFGAVLAAKDLVDTTPPSFQDLAIYENLVTPRPYVYVAKSHPAAMVYQFNVQDFPDGFGTGSIQVTGPGGRTITTPFANKAAPQSSGLQCGIFSGGDPTDLQCGIPVSYPPGTPAGQWVVSKLVLTDLAGNTATFRNVNGAPITVTSDRVVSASHFKLSPDPVNDWSTSQLFYPVNLSMQVSGAHGGISAVFVDTSASGVCDQTSTTPTVSGGTVTVPMHVFQGTALCQITGIAIVDGAGNVALYGFEYAAPDPFLLIKQTPDTIPPTATSASINPSTVASSASNGAQITLTVHVNAPVAPVVQLDISLFDSQNNVLATGGGSTTQSGGVVTQTLTLPALSAGSYKIGFTLRDAGDLTNTYGPNSSVAPTLTVTP